MSFSFEFELVDDGVDLICAGGLDPDDGEVALDERHGSGPATRGIGEFEAAVGRPCVFRIARVSIDVGPVSFRAMDLQLP